MQDNQSSLSTYIQNQIKIMKFVFLAIVSIVYREVYSQKEYGTECDSPITCIDSTTFAFCTIIDGKEELVGNQTCSEGQICSTLDNFHPCLDDVTLSTIITKKTNPTEITASITTKKNDPTTTTAGIISTTRGPTETTYRIITTTNAPTTTVSPPDCGKSGSGNYLAPKCNQYYECWRVLWWWESDLKNCPKNKAFSGTSRRCVPLAETTCKI